MSFVEITKIADLTEEFKRLSEVLAVLLNATRDGNNKAEIKVSDGFKEVKVLADLTENISETKAKIAETKAKIKKASEDL